MPDPGSTATILLDLAILVLAAKLAGEAAERLKQPAVVGEIVVGAFLGAGMLGGVIGLPDLDHAAAQTSTPAGQAAARLVLETIAGLGAILLLFQVGLQSDMRQLARVGGSSLLVAAIGVVASFAAGFAGSAALSAAWSAWHAPAGIPDVLLHVFVGAALTATSVGITARVLADLRRLTTGEARVVLGAAVLDDVAGLLILAVVGAMVAAATSATTATALPPGPGSDAATAIQANAADAVRHAFDAVPGIVVTLLAAAVFLVLAVVAGLRWLPRLYDAATARFKISGFPVALALGFALVMAWLAEVAGLSGIIGGFAAGLALGRTRGAARLFDEVKPFASLLVGVFFVTVGMRIDARTVAQDGPAILGAAALLTVLAVGAKLLSGFGVLRGQADRLVVGVGMVPRGEVGLIFAGIGLAGGLLDARLYAVLVLVALFTTLVTPLWLSRLHGRFTPDATETPPGEARHLAQVMDA